MTLSLIGVLNGVLLGLGLGAVGAAALSAPFSPDIKVTLLAFLFSAAAGEAFGAFPARRDSTAARSREPARRPGALRHDVGFGRFQYVHSPQFRRIGRLDACRVSAIRYTHSQRPNFC